ncbi:MAG: HypC/HybG/HupF family hydrogenase formation chaperone [Isosphaeraceae bacterium]
MCLGIPGKVVEILDMDNDLAKVEVSGVRRTINVALLKDENLQPGEWVLIHVGFALSKIDESEAQLTLGFDKMELLQLEEKRKDWDKRLTAIGREVDEEPARIVKSYEVQAYRVEPIGVVYLWPISG